MSTSKQLDGLMATDYATLEKHYLVNMELITLNFGLVGSARFPDVARRRVLTTAHDVYPMELQAVAGAVIEALLKIGCVLPYESNIKLSTSEPTLVIKVLYPVGAEKAECAPPSVLRYSKYHRLYEVACAYAQDCIAVLQSDGTGVLVGANCRDWGCSFDKDKFIVAM